MYMYMNMSVYIRMYPGVCVCTYMDVGVCMLVYVYTIVWVCVCKIPQQTALKHNNESLWFSHSPYSHVDFRAHC